MVIQNNSPKLLSITRIWNAADHNALTDLIDYQGSLLCAFRESDSHFTGQDGVIRIIRSKDGEVWHPIALIEEKGIDLRDPKFSITPEGALMLSLGGATYRKGEYKGVQSVVTFSKNGETWSPLVFIDLPEEWIWGITWHGKIGYGVSYRLTDPSDTDQPWICTLFKTTDGIHYHPVTQFDVSHSPSETRLRFLNDTMIAMVRRRGKSGWIGRSIPPYDKWEWTDTGTRFGGPNFIILPNGKMWAASRYIVGIDDDQKTFTAIGPMTPTSYHPFLILPSGGDTSYPGLVYKEEILYVSYYSSHEEKTSVYLAKLRLPN